MAVSLYNLTVPNYLQILHGVAGFLEKGLEHMRKAGIDPDSVVETRIYEDMLPFRFQVHSVAHHSAGALDAVMTGTFSPPSGLPEHDYAGLQQHIDEAIRRVKAFSEKEVNSREGADVGFNLGGRVLPFIAEEFVMSFSLPNLHFHAATAYGILRAKGAPLGKRDYIGTLQMKA